MRLPFTAEQFLAVVADLNRAIWPSQLGATALGLLALWLALRGGPTAARLVPLLLAGAWAFVGAVFHLAFLAPINPAAGLFGALFLLQAGLFAWSSQARALTFGWHPGPRGVAGLTLVTYAMVAYPILGTLLGRPYPRAPSFGAAPCPTTIFTLGVLLLARGDVPARLLAIPALWSLVGVASALRLGLQEDLGLVAAGAMAAALLLPRPRRVAAGS